MGETRQNRHADNTYPVFVELDTKQTIAMKASVYHQILAEFLVKIEMSVYNCSQNVGSDVTWAS